MKRVSGDVGRFWKTEGICDVLRWSCLIFVILKITRFARIRREDFQKAIDI